MHFRFTALIRDAHLHCEERDVLYFDFDGPHNITTTIRCGTPDEQLSFGEALCITTSEWEPSDKLHGMFQSLAEGRLPSGSVESDPKGHDDFVDEHGLLVENAVIPLEVMPQPFQSLAQQIREELVDYATRAVGVLRWRNVGAGLHNSINPYGRIEWSFDAKQWRILPHIGKIHIEAVRLLELHLVNVDEIRDFVRGGTAEPIAHELYREAWQQKVDNPRSAIVIGVAAVEIGVKDCISTLVPDSRWLVEHLPSPPLIQMLTEYLPRLPILAAHWDKVKAAPVPKYILDELKKAISIRNNIAHVGTASLSRDDVKAFLLVVRDLLYLLDYYRGYSWALANARRDVQRYVMEDSP